MIDGFSKIVETEQELWKKEGILEGLSLEEKRREFLETTKIQDMKKKKFKKLYNELFNFKV